jgi:hypothetical protein
LRLQTRNFFPGNFRDSPVIITANSPFESFDRNETGFLLLYGINLCMPSFEKNEMRSAVFDDGNRATEPC